MIVRLNSASKITWQNIGWDIFSEALLILDKDITTNSIIKGTKETEIFWNMLNLLNLTTSSNDQKVQITLCKALKIIVFYWNR